MSDLAPLEGRARLSLRTLSWRLSAPTHALPLDAFRVLVGLLALGYCLRLLTEVPTYWAPDGLMDHAASRAVFWFTWQPLFQPGMSAPAIIAALGLGCLLALAIVVGARPRACAGGLYLLVVCGYRFNFLLLFVDDVVVHLLLLWVALLPVGTTLTLSARLRGGPGVWTAWRAAVVPGMTARLFVGNLALLYAVAGVTKWASPLWLSGDAVYATLMLPCSRVAAAITPRHLPLLRALDYATLALEPLVALGLCLPARGATRWVLAVTMAGFHLGIVATLDLPFANLGCLTALPLVFREGFTSTQPPTEAPRGWPRPARAEWAAAGVLALLVGAMACSVLQRQWRQPTRTTASRGVAAEAGGLVQTGFYGALWCLGLAQQYRLLDWIDERNFHVVTTFRSALTDGSPPRVATTETILPPGTRTTLLLSYLGGVTWTPVPPGSLEALRGALRGRLAMRYCRANPAAATLELRADFVRVDPGHPTPWEHTTLARFECGSDGSARLLTLMP